MMIDDIGPHSVDLAKEILRQIGSPYGKTPLRDIACAIGIKQITEKPLTNVEGALFIPEGKAYGEILLNTAKDLRRTHFTLAHELGHYVHPYHHANDSGEFRCSTNDMFINNAANNSKEKQREAEANIFASELVMPTVHLERFYKLTNLLTVEQLVKLSDELFVSREALFRKIADNNSNAVASYFIKDKKVRYFRSSNSFPKPKIWAKQVLPTTAISNTYNGSDNSPSGISANVAHLWLRQPKNVNLTEQTFVQENGYQITLLKI